VREGFAAVLSHEEDVGRFEIAMHDPGLVRLGKRFGNIDDDARGQRERQLAVTRKARF
jgi:hypothetical protein